jgi:hypothetical protein
MPPHLKPHIRRAWLGKHLGYGWIAFEHRTSHYMLTYSTTLQELFLTLKYARREGLI